MEYNHPKQLQHDFIKFIVIICYRKSLVASDLIVNSITIIIGHFTIDFLYHYCSSSSSLHVALYPPGIGVGLATSAAFVALNHYFKNKRGQAVGLSMAGTAGGMLFLPQIVRLLLESFSFSGAILVLAGLALHAAFGKFSWLIDWIPVRLLISVLTVFHFLSAKKRLNIIAAR